MGKFWRVHSRQRTMQAEVNKITGKGISLLQIWYGKICIWVCFLVCFFVHLFFSLYWSRVLGGFLQHITNQSADYKLWHISSLHKYFNWGYCSISQHCWPVAVETSTAIFYLWVWAWSCPPTAVAVGPERSRLQPQKMLVEQEARLDRCMTKIYELF